MFRRLIKFGQTVIVFYSEILNAVLQARKAYKGIYEENCYCINEDSELE